MYLYELPTTGSISFSEFCIDQSTHKGYSFYIQEATQARANLRGILKESKRADHGEKDFLQSLKIIEEYIPHLRGIMSCVAHDEIGLKSEPIFSWRTTLSATLFNSSPRLSLPGLHPDLAFTLLTYAATLSNHARSIVVALGPYEHDRAISESSRKAKDDQLNFAVTLLCRASGIFSHVSESVLLEWETARTGVWGGGGSRPPELSREVNSALAKMALADAQTLAIRKLLSKSAYDANIAPGPPLPKSHPSPLLIAKLHLECASLYSSARTLAKTPGATPSSSGTHNNSGAGLKSPSTPGSPLLKGASSSHSYSAGGGAGSSEVSGELRKYLAEEATLHGALAKKWLGVDAGENGGADRGGEAVGFLGWAKRELDEIKGGSGGARGAIGGFGKGKGDKEKKGLKKERVGDEMESVDVFWKHYKKVNDTLHFKDVPTQPQLQARIPTGRLAVAAKAYEQSAPLFGPGSEEYRRRKAEEADVSNPGSDADGRHEVRAGNEQPKVEGTYAGAGAYF